MERRPFCGEELRVSSPLLPYAPRQRKEAHASSQEGACYLQVGLPLAGVKVTGHGHLHQLDPGTLVRFTLA